VVALAAELRPDVVLLDIQMPDGDGVAAALEIRRRFPGIAVVMLTSFQTDEPLLRAMQAGVQGYLLKDMSGDALMAAIRGVARGEPQLHPAAARRLMALAPPPGDPLAQLTVREREVLRLLGSGRSNKEIGAALFLSEATVKGYVSEVLAKLEVQDRTQAALLAVRYGLVKAGDW
jgi:DNA-binding NarL/FixJ family response regulator